MYQVNILNPKAGKLLQDLSDLQLISIIAIDNDPFLAVVNRMRAKSAHQPLTLEAITKEVELVRARRYARNKA